MTGAVEIRDCCGNHTVCDPDEIAATIGEWFLEPVPDDVRDGIAELQDAVLAGRYTGGLESFLGLTVEVAR